MEEMKNLRDLLKHELEDLYSAEEQILEGLPAMIEKAENQDLKNSLNDHFRVTKTQKARLDKVKTLLGEEAAEEDKGFFAKLFTGGEKHHCEAMEGLIKEGEKLMNEDMDPEVRDAAIIGAAQKIEHYEISGYGTAKAFALHLGLQQVARLLNESLQEEYEADLLLTDLAVAEVNLEATEEEGVKGLRKLSGGRAENKTSRSSSKTPASARNGKGSNGRKSNGSSSKTTSRSSSAKSSSRSKTSRGSSRSKAGSSRKGR